MYKVKLKSCGNIDFGQTPNKPVNGAMAETLKVADFAEASKKCRDYIAKYELGAGNWIGGKITDEAGKVVARVSYNGRVWPAEEWKPGMEPLYIP